MHHLSGDKAAKQGRGLGFGHSKRQPKQNNGQHQFYRFAAVKGFHHITSCPGARVGKGQRSEYKIGDNRNGTTPEGGNRMLLSPDYETDNADNGHQQALK